MGSKMNHDVLKMYNLPKEVKFCTRCVMSNQRPRITFDDEGVCSACRFSDYKNQKIDWESREKELQFLCDLHRRNDGRHDVIVPSSGGKDSSYVAHTLKYKYGMNPLTVTWSPHLYTPVGWENLQSSIHIGGLDNMLVTPNGPVHRKLTKLFLEVLGDPFQPFIYGQTNLPLQISVAHKIPLIMYGENGEVEYGGDMKNAHRPTRDYRIDHRHHCFSGIDPLEITKYGIKQEEIVPYLAPAIYELQETRTEVHYFSYYHKWVPQENFYYCSQNTGFKVNPERSEGTYTKFASLDDKFDGFHYYLGFIKFGIGRATSDAAHEIRDGYITRDEGVTLVRKFDGEFPKKYFREFLEYCDITEEYFWEVVDSWRSPHLWLMQDGKWVLRSRV